MGNDVFDQVAGRTGKVGELEEINLLKSAERTFAANESSVPLIKKLGHLRV